MCRSKKMIAVSAAAFIIVVLLLYFAGIIHINHPGLYGYEIKGVDVSEYQGNIDWQTLSSQGMDFAYIKATEGSSYTDARFSYNLENSLKTDMRIGFYHFFSFESPGKTQAENYINNVPVMENMLPPVIDVELYGRFRREPPDKDAVTKELDDIIKALTDTYGQTPIIYCTELSYSMYIKDVHPECRLWLRNVYSHPGNNDRWVFWQYDSRTRLKGYAGEEAFIDMNVFRSSEEEFINFNTKTSNGGKANE